MIKEIVNQYDIIKGMFPKIIDISGIKAVKIANELNISKQSFYRKKANNDFTHYQVKQILEMVKIETIEEQLFFEHLDAIRNSENATKEEIEEAFKID